MALRPGPLGGRYFEPLLNPPVRGIPPPGVLGQKSNAASLPPHHFPKGNGVHPKITLITSCSLFLSQKEFSSLTMSVYYFENQNQKSQQWENVLSPDLNSFLAHHVSTRPYQVSLSPKVP